MNVKPSEELTELVKMTVIRVRNEIEGRMHIEKDNIMRIGEGVGMAGGGDHLEIGTLFGGSAIVAALVKQGAGLEGKVYCVDPLDGYYRDMCNYKDNIDPESGIPVSPEIVMQNAKRFGVEDRLAIIPKKSHPFPEELKHKRFITALIDGDHWAEMPWLDWMSVKDKVNKYVMFDNYDDKHPAVMEAAEKAAQDEEWEKVEQTGIVFVLGRVRCV